MASVAQAVLRGSRDWHCPRPTVYKSGTLVLTSGRAFFCQSPVASTWPLAGLSRDHFIPHLLILQSATLLNKVLLTCNAWTMFRRRFRYEIHRLMKIYCLHSRPNSGDEVKWTQNVESIYLLLDLQRQKFMCVDFFCRHKNNRRPAAAARSEETRLFNSFMEFMRVVSPTLFL